MRPRSFSAAFPSPVVVALLALAFPSAAGAYIPPDQRTVYDEMIRDMRANREHEAHMKKLWGLPPPSEPKFKSPGPWERLEREAREAWDEGERRMRAKAAAREAARAAREAEVRALTQLYDGARDGDPEALMQLGKRNENSAFNQYGLREYQRVQGPRRAEALRRMAELMQKHAGENNSALSFVIPLDDVLRQLALLDDARAAAQLAGRKLARSDYYQAGNYFAQAGAAGDEAAQKQAIRLVAEDRTEAVSVAPDVFYDWCRVHADKGDLAAQWVLGRALATGGEIAKNPEEAIRRLRAVAERDPGSLAENERALRVQAAQLAGVILLEGRGVPADAGTAVALLENAAEAGSTPAMFSLGAAYLRGRGVEEDQGKGLSWLTQAGEAGDARAAELLGSFYLQEDLAEFDEAAGLDWLQKAAKRRPRAMLDYGKILAAGTHGVARDQERATEFFLLAAQRYPDDPEVLTFFGNAYLEGQYGFPVNAERGERLLKAAKTL